MCYIFLVCVCSLSYPAYKVHAPYLLSVACPVLPYFSTGKAYTGFWWGNLREKDHFGKHRRRWEDNIKMDLQEVGCGGMDWFELAQVSDRWRTLVTAVMHLLVP